MEHAFWDSSAIVPLCVQQPSTAAARVLCGQYGITLWWATPVEVRSALARLLRMGLISSGGRVQALVVLDNLRGKCREVQPDASVRERAEQLIDRFALTAADAMQLAAAWVWCQGHPRQRAFVCGDAQLRDGAAQLGFKTIET